MPVTIGFLIAPVASVFFLPFLYKVTIMTVLFILLSSSSSVVPDPNVQIICTIRASIV